MLGWEPGVFLAAGLAALHAVMLGAVFGRSASVAIQLRGLFTAVALLGAVLHLPALHRIQLAGTAVRLFLGYCLGGRVLLLLSWNRSRRLLRLASSSAPILT